MARAMRIANLRASLYLRTVSARVACRSSCVLAAYLAITGCAKDEGPQGELETSSGATGDETSEPTGGEVSREVCDRYLACVEAATPTALPAAQAGFGVDAMCWQGDSAAVQQCVDGCTSLLADYHAMFPAEPACCPPDVTCDEPVCGNGIVDGDEFCDSQPLCEDDCQGPALCNPRTNFGCGAGDTHECSFLIEPALLQLRTSCVELADEPHLAPGDDCSGDVGVCGAGVQCLSGAVQTAESCAHEACCAPFCDVTRPDSCADGSVCKDHRVVMDDFEFMDEALDWLGLCVKP